MTQGATVKLIVAVRLNLKLLNPASQSQFNKEPLMTDPFTAALVGACIALVGSNVTRLIGLEKRVAKLSRIEAKLDALLTHSGIEYDPCEGVDVQIIEALKAGNKIEAIKRYKEASGESLKTSKEYIEELQRRGDFGG